ncbi:putative Cysteine-rich secretory protein 1 [Hypsibius exemplaris]|uniref:Cysteine-rich secretory protein 1 n=1 Tax=Hypsibius exemplaris TaxID=2072580 RepID=A0A9X6NH33_HYPEX|nr:putative Cysteine-rich secretory protein 1 [Hypsibius exemplaris]
MSSISSWMSIFHSVHLFYAVFLLALAPSALYTRELRPVVSHSQEIALTLPLQSLTQSASASVVLSAHSTFRDHNGRDHDILWHTTVSASQLAHIDEIIGSAKCLQGLIAQWVNITVAPLEVNRKTVPTSSGNGTRKDEQKLKAEATTVKPSPILTTKPPPRQSAHNATMGPSHCDPLERYSKSDSLTISLTSADVSDPEGIKITELDAHKIESVANYTVRKHNCLRSRVSPEAGNMLRMEWNQEAADQAQDWADQCSYNHNNETNRTTSLFPCGQNIAYTTPWAFSWNSVINMWYNEYLEYKFGEPNDLHVVGHYTAMVWATTYQLGCAYKDCGGWHFYVCHYCPNGNFGDLSAPYKAGSACENCPDSCERGLCTNTCPHTNIYSNCDELERKFKICSNRFQEKLALNCKATCLCPGSIYL